ncbi:MAG: TAXI family TRAP transporter solute-binding subunit [Deltaproteobacteria bacterium]|nr:TAXI family TRAP transporter solute-binding subunit [Deltaproteobacteria bacterium]
MKAIRLRTVWFVILTLLWLSLPLTLAAQEKPRILRWATWPAGSVNHVMTSAMASVVDKHYKSSSRVASYAAFTDYIPLMNRGETDFGILNALEAWGAYHAIAPYYQEKHRNLRLIWAAPAGKVSVLVRADSKYKKIADLKGARVAGGYDGHMGCRFLSQAVVATGGLTYKDMNVMPVSGVVTGIQALIDGRVEASTCSSPGMPIIREADARIGVRWLPIETHPQAVKSMQKIFPGSFPDTLKSGDAPGLKETIPVVGYHFYFSSGTKAEDNTVYQVLKTLWEHNEDLFKINPQLKYWTHDQVVQENAAIPYHPAAIRFLKEKRVWTPEMDKVQQELLATK